MNNIAENGHDNYILMLEQDVEDRWITSQTLQELNVTTPFKFLNYTYELFEWLKHHARPMLILINFKTSPDDVFSVLRQLKTNDSWSDIPVVILAENTPTNIVRECYRLGAASFVVKPSGQENTRNKIGAFIKYWSEVAVLPNNVMMQ